LIPPNPTHSMTLSSLEKTSFDLPHLKQSCSRKITSKPSSHTLSKDTKREACFNSQPMNSSLFSTTRPRPSPKYCTQFYAGHRRVLIAMQTGCVFRVLAANVHAHQELYIRITVSIYVPGFLYFCGEFRT